MAYARFAAMIATSSAFMFGAMYLNSYQLSHVRFSETRLYMTFLMAAIMSLVMLLFMRKMYHNRRINLGIIGASLVIFCGSLWLVRSQATVDDLSYMKAMIPHHSIAIMTSQRAQIQDPRVRDLADRIIEAQVREISEMENLIQDLQHNRKPEDTREFLSSRERNEYEARDRTGKH